MSLGAGRRTRHVHPTARLKPWAPRHREDVYLEKGKKVEECWLLQETSLRGPHILEGAGRVGVWAARQEPLTSGVSQNHHEGVGSRWLWGWGPGTQNWIPSRVEGPRGRAGKPSRHELPGASSTLCPPCAPASGQDQFFASKHMTFPGLRNGEVEAVHLERIPYPQRGSLYPGVCPRRAAPRPRTCPPARNCSLIPPCARPRHTGPSCRPF